MQNKVISDWLGSKRDYATGLALLEQCEGRSFNVCFLEGKHTLQFARAKLVSLLEGYNNNRTAVKPVTTTVRHVAKEVFKSYATNDGVVDARIAPYVERAKFTYKKMAALHQQIYSVFNAALIMHKTDAIAINNYLAERHVPVLVNEMLDLDDACVELFEICDRFFVSGELPDAPANPGAVPDDRYELEKELQRVRSWISRHKKNPLKARELKSKTTRRDALQRRLYELI